MKPILFSSPMIRAILAGLKTQTRRVVQPQPRIDIDGTVVFPWASFFADGHVHTWNDDGVGGENWWANEYPNENKFSVALSKTEHTKAHPYGRVGDKLWIKEACWIWGQWHLNGKTPTGRDKWRFKAIGQKVRFDRPEKTAKRGGGAGWVYRHARFMPRWACRLEREITDIRIERVQAISEEDAVAEGAEPMTLLPGEVIAGWTEYKMGFAFLWDSINAGRDNGIYSWAANPWVWVVEFAKV